MAWTSVSFDPDSVASTSDVASSAYDLAATASNTASSAYLKAAAASAAVSNALSKATVASVAAAAVASVASDASSLASDAMVKAAAASTAAAAASSVAAGVSDTASNALSKATIASTAVADKADVAYVTAPAASSIAGFRGSFQASEALVFPQLCYMNTNGFMALANANSAATATAFLAMAPGSVANAASFAAIMPGTMVGHTAWNWTIGTPIYMKSSAGGMTQTRPSAASAIVRIVGYAGRNSNVMFFNPDGTWVEVT